MHSLIYLHCPVAQLGWAWLLTKAIPRSSMLTLPMHNKQNYNNAIHVNAEITVGYVINVCWSIIKTKLNGKTLDEGSGIFV